MKLAELYSLTAGQKLDKIHTIEKYFPIPFEKYILIQPWTKQSKCYDFWDETLSLIAPILEKNGIKIIQAGQKDEKPLNNCYHTMGQTNWGQLEYLVSKAELVLSSDSVCSHLAGHYNKPLVVLISNNFKETVSPYFGDKSKQIILEPNRSNKNPSFMLDEGPNKQINEIKPETIASSTCKLLNLEFNYEYKTLQIGPEYKNRIIESANDCLINVNQLGLQNLIVRNDYNYNLDNLFKQIQIVKTSVVTDKEIPIEPLQQLRPNILEILFKVTKENNNPQFIKNLQKAKIPCRLFSYLSEGELNPLKLDYLDCQNGIIHRKNPEMPEILKNKDLNNIYVKSSKFILSEGKIFQSFYHLKHQLPIPSFDPIPQQILDIDLNYLWQDLEYLYFLEKIS